MTGLWAVTLRAWRPFDLAQDGLGASTIRKRIVNIPAKILVVDDTAKNVKLLADLLSAKGYSVVTAESGRDALAQLEAERPDLVLLDVVMPEMSGYEVCEKIRANPATRILPVVMVTALDPGEERVKGLDAGADDFLTKPINRAELLARVRSLLRIKELQDEVQSQAAELSEWNKKLAQRVEEQVNQLERLGRLKRFFSPQLAELIVSGDAEDPLKTHRRDLTVVYLDLRGFTAFAETAEPEEVMEILHEYHAAMGKLILEYEGTLEHFAGDGMMIFFNDPVPVENAAERAVRMTLAMRERVKELSLKWRKLGHDLDFGVGIAQGYTTIGAIGFEERWEYGAIGSVPNVAARLCGEAKPGEILVTQRLLGGVDELVEAEPAGELTLKGFHRPISAHKILQLKA
jgi:adenylate cyclase